MCASADFINDIQIVGNCMTRVILALAKPILFETNQNRKWTRREEKSINQESNDFRRDRDQQNKEKNKELPNKNYLAIKNRMRREYFRLLNTTFDWHGIFG